MTDLKGLLERVEKVEGPDREIDREIGFTLDGWTLERLSGPFAPPEKFIRVRGSEGQGDFYCVDDPNSTYTEFTESIDAAVALVEKLLPDHGWFIRRDDTDANGKRAAPVYNASLLYPDALRVCASSAHARVTPALALIAALLRALIAQQELSK